MRNGFRARRESRRLRLLEPLESRVLLSAAVVETSHSFQVEAIVNATDPVSALQTHFALSMSRGVETKLGSAPVTTNWGVLLITVTDPSTQQTVASFEAVPETTGTPPYTLTLSPNGNSVQFNGVFALQNDMTGATDTMAVNLNWKFGQSGLQDTEEQLEITPASTNDFSSTQIGGGATVSGSVQWTQLESALQGQITPAANLLTPTDPTAYFSFDDGQTITPARAELPALVKALTPPDHIPASASVFLNSARAAKAESDNWNDVVYTLDGMRNNMIPAPPSAAAGSFAFIGPNYVTHGDTNLGGFVSRNLQSADLVASVPAEFDQPDGTSPSAMVSINLHWQATGEGSSMTLDKYVSYEGGVVTSSFNESTTVPAAVTGSITSDYPGFVAPTLITADIELSSSIQITTPIPPARSLPVSFPVYAPISNLEWQSVVVHPWHRILKLLSLAAPPGPHLPPGRTSLVVRAAPTMFFGSPYHFFAAPQNAEDPRNIFAGSLLRPSATRFWER